MIGSGRAPIATVDCGGDVDFVMVMRICMVADVMYRFLVRKYPDKKKPKKKDLPPVPQCRAAALVVLPAQLRVGAVGAGRSLQ